MTAEERAKQRMDADLQDGEYIVQTDDGPKVITPIRNMSFGGMLFPLDTTAEYRKSHALIHLPSLKELRKEHDL